MKSCTECVIFFIYKIIFQFLCYKIGLKITTDEIHRLGKAQALKLWVKIAYRIAFYPQTSLHHHVHALEKRTNQSIDANSIGPGSEFLYWFQSLYPEDTQRNYVRLTKKQQGFIFALSNKLDTLPPSTIFKMLNSPKLVNAWFTIAKVLADRSFENLDELFEKLSEQTDFSISSDDLLNYKTMLVWLRECLEFCSRSTNTLKNRSR